MVRLVEDEIDMKLVFDQEAHVAGGECYLERNEILGHTEPEDSKEAEVEVAFDDKIADHCFDHFADHCADHFSAAHCYAGAWISPAGFLHKKYFCTNCTFRRQVNLVPRYM